MQEQPDHPTPTEAITRQGGPYCIGCGRQVALRPDPGITRAWVNAQTPDSGEDWTELDSVHPYTCTCGVTSYVPVRS